MNLTPEQPYKNKHIKRFKKFSRKPHAVPIITFVVLLFFTMIGLLVAHFMQGSPTAIATKDSKIVIISQGKEQQIVPSNEKTVGVLLKKLNIKLAQGDVVEPAMQSVINQDQFRINIYRAKPIQINDGSDRTYTFSASKTPRAVAQQTGAVLYPEDIIDTQPVRDFLKQGAIGEQVIVKRATPISVDLYGTKVELRTQAKTVAELIKEKNIKLIKDDKILPAPETPISAGQQVSFLRTGTKTETVTEPIATPTETVRDPSLTYGTKAVRQQGAPGQQTVTYEIAITNNKETGRRVIQQVVTKAPVAQIEVVGTSLSGIKGNMALAGIAPEDYNYADYIISHESGWRPDAGPRGVSGPYGLCQAYPGTKMASAGADWQTNPVTQLRWCAGYAKSRYGTWGAAYNHWVATRNW